jgi:hypothetical protein
MRLQFEINAKIHPIPGLCKYRGTSVGGRHPKNHPSGPLEGLFEISRKNEADSRINELEMFIFVLYPTPFGG